MVVKEVVRTEKWKEEKLNRRKEEDKKDIREGRDK